mmetsp:Transcript_1535/g.4956  ORF Transcript_1535/g.4956 Transcript_1535/m.4956 type:complete len:255 (-) Transcript_1535:334-1098(-)|eukprot:scaffold59438_cov26-Tisochrysis_lutea.AAC.3
MPVPSAGTRPRVSPLAIASAGRPTKLPARGGADFLGGVKGGLSALSRCPTPATIVVRADLHSARTEPLHSRSDRKRSLPALPPCAVQGSGSVQRPVCRNAEPLAGADARLFPCRDQLRTGAQHAFPSEPEHLPAQIRTSYGCKKRPHAGRALASPTMDVHVLGLLTFDSPLLFSSSGYDGPQPPNCNHMWPAAACCPSSWITPRVAPCAPIEFACCPYRCGPLHVPCAAPMRCTPLSHNKQSAGGDEAGICREA